MLAGIARFCVRRRRWVLAAWMLLFVAGIAIGTVVFGRLHDSNGGAGTESVQGYIIKQQASSMGPTAVVLVKGPPALAIIGVATFALLFLMTGSVLIPVKALVMNVISLGATFGALVWIFQDGHLSSLLGFTAIGAIEAWVPVIVFTFAFGLSMDYEVFLLSRIKEAYDECGDTNRAVADGLQRSGRIITCAALLIMIVFLGFAAGQTLGIKEMGLALAIAVAVDATLVRCVLVPATMTLLGPANWWAPAPLRRLHQRIGLHEPPAHPASPVATPSTEAPSVMGGPSRPGDRRADGRTQEAMRTTPVP